MPDPVRVMVQLHSTPSLAAAAFGPVAAMPAVGIRGFPGAQFDTNYSPVPIPPKPAAGAGGPSPLGMAMAFSAATPATYVARAAVQSDALADFLDKARNDPGVVGVFADPRIQPIALCPNGPIGTDLDI